MATRGTHLDQMAIPKTRRSNPVDFALLPSGFPHGKAIGPECNRRLRETRKFFKEVSRNARERNHAEKLCFLTVMFGYRWSNCHVFFLFLFFSAKAKTMTFTVETATVIIIR